jgi:hypothetical protein
VHIDGGASPDRDQGRRRHPSKALYRVCGAAVGVRPESNLVDATKLQRFAVALRVAACLYVSLLDWTPQTCPTFPPAARRR